MPRNKKAKRNPRGMGSVFKRCDGFWVAAVTVGRDVNGKQLKRTKVCKTREEAIEAHKRLQRLSMGRALHNRQNLTVTEWFETYAELRAKEVKPRTAHVHKLYLKQVIDRCGTERLQRLNYLHCRSLFGDMTQKYSPSFCQHVYDFMKAGLRTALEADLIDMNPLDKVKKPKGGKVREVRLWSREEAHKFLEGIKEMKHRLYPAFFFLLHYGLRIGELLALKWDDWQENTLRIDETVSVFGFTKPKTARSVRELPLNETAKEVLKERRQRYLIERAKAMKRKKWQEHNVMFGSLIGAPHNYRNFLHRYEFLLTKTKTRRINLHGMRHTWVTLMRESGVAAEVLATLAGHDVKTMMAVYSQVTDERKQKAIGVLDGLYEP